MFGYRLSSTLRAGCWTLTMPSKAILTSQVVNLSMKDPNESNSLTGLVLWGGLNYDKGPSSHFKGSVFKVNSFGKRMTLNHSKLKFSVSNCSIEVVAGDLGTASKADFGLILRSVGPLHYCRLLIWLVGRRHWLSGKLISPLTYYYRAQVSHTASCSVCRERALIQLLRLCRADEATYF